MDRLWLLPALLTERDSFWKRMFYGLALTSIEAFLAVACLLAGIPVLIDPVQFAPASMHALNAPWLIYPWGAGMLFGGAFSLGGIVSSKFRVERMGIAALSSVALVYSLALVAALPGSLFACVSYFIFFLATLARYWVLGIVIKRQNVFRQAMKELFSRKES